MANPLYDNLISKNSKRNTCFLEQNGKAAVSFCQFSERTNQVANLLVKYGLQPGDRVAVQAAKTIEIVILYAATIQAGGVFLSLNTDYKKDEVAYFLKDAEPRIFVCDPYKVEDLKNVASQVGSKILTVDAHGKGSLLSEASLMSKKFNTVHRKPDDLAALLYTSGTTGRSKGAMLTQNNLLSNAKTLKKLWQVTKSDILIHALPIFHTHGLFVALNTAMLAGAKVNFIPKFDIDEIIERLHASTLLMGVPTFYTRLLADYRLTEKLTKNMRLFISGSAPLLSETHEEFTKRTGHHILERYGMTETNMITSNPYHGERRPGTVGKPLADVQMKITDPETGKEMVEGKIGMIEVRGPNVFKGYWNMPDKTALELRETGYFITGDLGKLSSDGYLSIVGREKDLIISGGYNVYPKEVEDILNALNQIDETAVFGIPDSDLGERVVAAVVLENNKNFKQSKTEVFVNEKLARYKQPKEYFVLDYLPRNSMGKVQKNQLRKQFST
jgi:malonyl-CoA/methylmalonyl-CoA synthetase